MNNRNIFLICIADSLCYKVETNIVKQLYPNKDVKEKRKKERNVFLTVWWLEVSDQGICRVG